MPPTWSTRQQRIWDWLKGSLPSWMFGLTDELWVAYVKIFDQVDDVVIWLWDQTYIGRAFGSWLDVHARDQGTARQGGEDDTRLRARLTNLDRVVTAPALEAEADAILTAFGLTTGAKIVNVGHDAMFLNTQGFLDVGYRLKRGEKPNTMVMVLPYGTTAAAKLAVAEMMRQKAAGGFSRVIEINEVA